MMRFIFFLVLLCFGGIVNSQTDFDQRLLAKFDKDQITTLTSSNPEIVAYWVFYLDHSYEILDMPGQKDLSGLETLQIRDLEKFNILDFDITMDRYQHKIFKIEGSNKMLRLLSNDAFAKKLNSHRGL